MEKAYTQANSLLANRSGGENSYLAMEGGGPIAIKHLTGTNLTNYSGSSYWYKYSNWQKIDAQTLSETVSAGGIAYVGGSKKVTSSDGKGQIYKSHAHMLLEYDSSTQKYLIRNPWGGEDHSSYDAEFQLTLDEITNESIPNRIILSDPITLPKTYTYTVTSDAPNSGAAVFEGKPITFTINRSDVGDTTTIYLSTVAGTADGNDYKSSEKTALTFGKQETSKTFVVETFNDALTEGTAGVDNFSLALFTKAIQSSATTSATAYIKDKAPRDYTYSISSNAGTSDDALTEGGKITFTISRAPTNSSDGENDSDSSIHLNTVDDTAVSTENSAD